MEDISKEERNYFTLARALFYVGSVLGQYTEEGFHRLHDRIKQTLLHLKTCQKRCSEKLGNNPAKWCSTCQQWRNELEKSHRNIPSDWSRTRSWEWPRDFRSIATVFAKGVAFSKPTMINFEDLSTALCLWENCNEFSIAQNIIDKLRELRNGCFAHPTKMGVTDQKLESSFKVMCVLFHEKDVQGFVNTQNHLKNLDTIQKATEIDLITMKQIREEIQECHDKAQLSTDQIISTIVSLETKILSLTQALNGLGTHGLGTRRFEDKDNEEILASLEQVKTQNEALEIKLEEQETKVKKQKHTVSSIQEKVVNQFDDKEEIVSLLSSNINDDLKKALGNLESQREIHIEANSTNRSKRRRCIGRCIVKWVAIGVCVIAVVSLLIWNTSMLRNLDDKHGKNFTKRSQKNLLNTSEVKPTPIFYHYEIGTCLNGNIWIHTCTANNLFNLSQCGVGKNKNVPCGFHDALDANLTYLAPQDFFSWAPNDLFGPHKMQRVIVSKDKLN